MRRTSRRSWGGVRGAGSSRTGCGRSRSHQSRRPVRPQGGGTQDTPDETLFDAIIQVLVSGCARRALPHCFGISKPTARHRFLTWSRASVGPAARGDPAPSRRRRPPRPLPRRPRLNPREGQKRGELTGPSPVGRGEPGSKMHVLSDAAGLPGRGLGRRHPRQPGLEAYGARSPNETRPQPRPRHFKPQRLYACTTYDIPELRKWLRGKRIGAIARKGVGSSERLGRRRWVIERTMS